MRVRPLGTWTQPNRHGSVCGKVTKFGARRSRQCAFHIAEAAANIRHRHTFFGTFTLVLHNLIEQRFGLLEGRRKYSGLTKALRLALLCDRRGTGPTVA